MYSKLYQFLQSNTTTNCTVPYFPHNDKVCTSQADRDNAFSTHYSRITNQFKDCEDPCDFLLLTLGGQNRKETDTDVSLVYFYFQSRTMVNEESLLYTPLSLFAEIGGYVGLMMGFSLFHIA